MGSWLLAQTSAKRYENICKNINNPTNKYKK